MGDLQAALPASPGVRPCCLFAAPLPIFGGRLPIPPFFDPADEQALEHRYGGGDVYGLVYTCRGGFLDLGHLRDLIDITRYYYVALGNPGRTFPPAQQLGSCVVKQDPADENERIAIARSMAFAESIYHEIESYWQYVFGGHQSSFSPEDLPSNWLGTYVAEQAIRDKGRAFDEAATVALKALLKQLDALEPKATSIVFTQAVLRREWVGTDPSRNSYLKRRNFTNSPWLVPEVPCLDTTWPTTISLVDSNSDAYEITFEVDPKREKASDEREKYLGEKVASGNFEYHVQQIAADAKTRYGADFNKP